MNEETLIKEIRELRSNESLLNKKREYLKLQASKQFLWRIENISSVLNNVSDSFFDIESTDANDIPPVLIIKILGIEDFREFFEILFPECEVDVQCEITQTDPEEYLYSYELTPVYDPNKIFIKGIKQILNLDDNGSKENKEEEYEPEDSSDSEYEDPSIRDLRDIDTDSYIDIYNKLYAEFQDTIKDNNISLQGISILQLKYYYAKYAPLKLFLMIYNGSENSRNRYIDWYEKIYATKNRI